ncbi:MAG: M20/M25/M40 family metallo-hydrolase [Oscillospiraceae bacterium]|nr:M20/M25/M40 family metallo-hydrolase [Oscillospiraceae bacterium]MBQ7089326.1 M20/M25/M40 family metallo-hydrolase [Clostridia bacterium]
MQKTLERLCAVNGPSGFEKSVAELARQLLAPLVDETYTTRLGSVVGVRRCGIENAPGLVLDAHLDEIGLLVTGQEEGFLRFRTIGGVDPRMLCDREVTLLTDPPAYGIVTCMPPHLQSREDMEKSTPVRELFIDIGYKGEAVHVPVGTLGTFRGGCIPLGDEQFCGKALDDRACMVTILRALELLADKRLNVNLYVLFSTREEVSAAGAAAAVWQFAPQMCVAVDVTHGDTPDGPKDKTFKLGGGPAIGIGPNMTRWMSRRLCELADREHIDYQREVMESHSGTNAWPMQISREGVATAVVSLPLKYMHTPIEVVSKADMEAVARLLAAFVSDPGEEVSVC